MKCACGYELVRTVERGDALIRVRNPLCRISEDGRVSLTLTCPTCKKTTRYSPTRPAQPALILKTKEHAHEDTP